VYRTDFRSFPIFNINRQISVDFDRYLCEKCVQVDYDRSPVINLYDRVKEKHFLLTDDSGTGCSFIEYFDHNLYRTLQLVCTCERVMSFFVAAPIQAFQIIDSVILFYNIYSPLVLVFPECPYPHVVHSDCEIGSHLHSSTYLRNAVDPCTMYPYQSLYCVTEARACSVALLFCWS